MTIGPLCVVSEPKVRVLPDTRVIDADIIRLQGLLDHAVSVSDFRGIAESASALVIARDQRQLVLTSAAVEVCVIPHLLTTVVSVFLLLLSL